MTSFGNRYKNLIASGSTQKSEFNTNPGIEYGLLRNKNPYAELIKKRFLEIKDDNNLLNYISNNGYTYYNTYIKYPNNVVYTMQLLNL